MSRKIFWIAAISVAYMVSAALFFRLPDATTRIWLIPEETSPWIIRAFLAFFLPTVALFVVILFRRLAAIEPFRNNYKKFLPTFTVIMITAVLVIIGLHFMLLCALLGASRWIGIIPPVLIGTSLLLAGNVFPRIRPNSVMGIRTPWTLDDEYVWSHTHRVAGYAFMFLGGAFFIFLICASRWIWAVFIFGLSGTAVALSLLSCVIWRSRIRRLRNTRD